MTRQLKYMPVKLKIKKLEKILKIFNFKDFVYQRNIKQYDINLKI